MEYVIIGDNTYELTDELIDALYYYVLDELYETRREGMNRLFHGILSIISRSEGDVTTWSSPTINGILLNDALETNIKNSLSEVMKLYAQKGWRSYRGEISDRIKCGMNGLLRVRVDIDFSSEWAFLYIDISSMITCDWIEENIIIEGISDFLNFLNISPIKI